MRRWFFIGSLAAALVANAATPAASQEAAAFLSIGTQAPDFELQGATRYGTLTEPVRLSDYRGETVILAFFFRARTPG